MVSRADLLDQTAGSHCGIAGMCQGAPKGFLATRREELQEFDAFDEAVFCRSRTWLFLSYVVSFGAVAGSVWVLMQASPRITRRHRGDMHHAPYTTESFAGQVKCCVSSC